MLMASNTKLKLKYILISLSIFIIDQLTKYILVNNLDYLINKNILIFTIDYVLNYGAAFNLFSGSRIFLSSVSIISAVVILYVILVNKNLRFTESIGLSLILGGTLSNGYERIKNGFVIDFININFIDFPVFNISDVSINIGFIFLLYKLLNERKK